MPNEPSHSSASAAASVFRIDRFVVSANALPAFIERVHRIQRMLGTMPGCQQNLVLTQTGGSGEFNVVTVVEWENAEAMVAAKKLVQKKYAEEGFDPTTFMQKLGVRADMGLYSNA
ncbi:MAG: antibiotic biosynthesis monooxygenase [Gammaproteobacteria bacterium]|nr:antibiotic biosynthesis monooxygenase [Gammaproteobacteria bacterium]